ncbi:MAG: Gfo/Idh/MocA family protein [Christensenellales bacterium]|jgi:scyllo-inositol 2-dehydrogenase (NADP+)
MTKIRVAIIGYGRSGRNIHRDLLVQLPEKYELVAFVDVDEDRRRMIREETGLEPLSDYRQLFGREDIDLVINASYSYEHACISCDLLLNGFNVLSEKPAAEDVAEFQQVLAAQRVSGKDYYVFQQYRFAPAYQKVKEIIASGLLGRIVQVSFHFDGFARRWDWQTVHAFTAGSLHNTGPHPMDWALDMMGFPQADELEVFCAMDRAHTAGNAEDYVKLLLRAPGAPVAEIEISACFGFGKDTYQVHGTRGCLTGADKGLSWKYYRDDEVAPLKLHTQPLRDDQGQPIYCREKLPVHEETWQPNEWEADAFNAKGLNFYNALYDTLTAGAPFLITNEQILLQMAVTEEAYWQNEELFQ